MLSFKDFCEQLAERMGLDLRMLICVFVYAQTKRLCMIEDFVRDIFDGAYKASARLRCSPAADVFVLHGTV